MPSADVVGAGKSRQTVRLHFKPRIVVKFRDWVEAPYEDGAEKVIAEKYGKADWANFEKAHGKPPSSPGDLREPKLMDPGVVDIVLDGLDLQGGRPHYARMDELDRTQKMLYAQDWCAGFRDENGRWPTEDEFHRLFGKLPLPPEGQEWRYEDGKLSLSPK